MVVKKGFFDITRIEVKVKPRSSRPGVARGEGECLVVRVSSAPTAGKANRELCKLLAKHLGVDRSAVRIVKGSKSREKVVEVDYS